MEYDTNFAARHNNPATYAPFHQPSAGAVARTDEVKVNIGNTRPQKNQEKHTGKEKGGGAWWFKNSSLFTGSKTADAIQHEVDKRVVIAAVPLKVGQWEVHNRAKERRSVKYYFYLTGALLIFGSAGGIMLWVFYFSKQSSAKSLGLQNAALVLRNSTGTGLAGSEDGYDASFNSPNGVATDAEGNIYVSDTGNNEVRKIDVTGFVSTLAGNASSLPSYQDGQGAAARFNAPIGIAVDPVTNLIFVVDSNNSLVRQIAPQNYTVTTIAGRTSLQTGSEDGQSTASSFNNPYGIAIDANQNLYVTDTSNNLVRQINSSRYVSTFAGVTTLSRRISSPLLIPLKLPLGIAVDSAGILYVVDSGNFQIVKIDPNDNSVRTILNLTSIGSAAIAIDKNNSLWVSQADTSNIQVVPQNGAIQTIAAPANSLSFLTFKPNGDVVSSMSSMNVIAQFVVVVSTESTTSVSEQLTIDQPSTSSTTTVDLPITPSTDDVLTQSEIPPLTDFISSTSMTSSQSTVIFTKSRRTLSTATLTQKTSTLAPSPAVTTSTTPRITSANPTSNMGGPSTSSSAAPSSMVNEGFAEFTTSDSSRFEQATSEPTLIASSTDGFVVESLTSSSPSASSSDAALAVASSTTTVASSSDGYVAKSSTSSSIASTSDPAPPVAISTTAVASSEAFVESSTFSSISPSSDPAQPVATSATTVASSDGVVSESSTSSSPIASSSEAAQSVASSTIAAASSNDGYTMQSALSSSIAYSSDPAQFDLSSTNVVFSSATFVDSATSSSPIASTSQVAQSDAASTIIIYSSDTFVESSTSLSPTASSSEGAQPVVSSTTVATASDEFSISSTYSSPIAYSSDPVQPVASTVGSSDNFTVQSPTSTSPIVYSSDPAQPLDSSTIEVYTSDGVVDSSTTLAQTATTSQATQSDASSTIVVYSSDVVVESSSSSLTASSSEASQSFATSTASIATSSGSFAVESSSTLSPTASSSEGLPSTFSTPLETSTSYTLTSEVPLVTPMPSIASYLSWITSIQAGSVTAGNLFSTQPVLLLTDQYGDAISGASVSLSLYLDGTCSTGAGSVGLTGNIVTSNSSGFAPFTAFNATTAGTYYVKAFYSGLNSSCSGQALTVTAASLASLSFTIQPSGSVAAGSSFTTQPTVLALDAFGNAVSASVTLAAYLNSGCTSSGSGSVSSGTTSTNSSGYAAYSGVSYNRAQTVYLKASSGSVSVCSTSNVVVSAASASILSWITSIQAGSVTAGNLFSTQPVLLLTDQYGDAISGASVSLSLYLGSGCSTGAGSVGLTGNIVTTNSSGFAPFIVFNATSAGSYYVKASNALRKTVFSPAPMVVAIDRYGNGVSSVTLAAYSDSGCTFATTPWTILNYAATSVLSNGSFYFSSIYYSGYGGMYLKATSGAISVCSTRIYVDLTVSFVAGSGTAGPLTNGVGAAAAFYSPTDMVTDSSGNIYVCDLYNSVIRKITLDGTVSTFAGSIYGYATGTGTSSKFGYPIGIAIDPSGTLFVTDTYNHRIRKITTPGAVTSLLAGSGVAGFRDATGATAKFNYPVGIALDASGNSYIADQWNYRIRKITSGGVVTTYAGSGAAGFLDATGTSAIFDFMSGVAFDSSGNVFVADKFNHRIRKISPTQVVTTLAGSGTPGTADGIGAAAGFNNPNNLVFDQYGLLYIADQDNSLIRVINTTTAMVTTIAGNGTGYLDGPGLSAQFGTPNGIWVDINGTFIVADTNNNKIRKMA